VKWISDNVRTVFLDRDDNLVDDGACREGLLGSEREKWFALEIATVKMFEKGPRKDEMGDLAHRFLFELVPIEYSFDGRIEGWDGRKTKPQNTLTIPLSPARRNPLQISTIIGIARTAFYLTRSKSKDVEKDAKHILRAWNIRDLRKKMWRLASIWVRSIEEIGYESNIFNKLQLPIAEYVLTEAFPAKELFGEYSKGRFVNWNGVASRPLAKFVKGRWPKWERVVKALVNYCDCGCCNGCNGDLDEGDFE
jgi:hypothetical protein